jgi:hypothetical protein
MQSDGELIPTDVEPAAFERPLPSGRTLVVRVGADGEEVEVRDRAGALELSIILTPEGPMVRIKAARIELESPETISVQCRRFEVETTEAIQLQSRGTMRVDAQEMHLKTESDIHLDGAMIRLNCETPPSVPVEHAERPSEPVG